MEPRSAEPNKIEDAAIEAALAHAPLSYQDHHSANEREVAYRALSQPTVIRRDMGLVRRRLKQGKFGLLNPNGAGVQTLELLNVIALGVTVYFTPYEGAYARGAPSPGRKSIETDAQQARRGQQMMMRRQRSEALTPRTEAAIYEA